MVVTRRSARLGNATATKSTSAKSASSKGKRSKKKQEEEIVEQEQQQRQAEDDVDSEEEEMLKSEEKGEAVKKRASPTPKKSGRKSVGGGVDAIDEGNVLELIMRRVELIEERLDSLSSNMGVQVTTLSQMKSRKGHHLGEDVAEACGITGYTPGALLGETKSDDPEKRKKEMKEKEKVGNMLYMWFCIAYLGFMVSSFFDVLPAFEWELLTEEQVDTASKYLADNMHVPYLLCLIYLIVIFGIKAYLDDKKPFNLRNELSAWSFLLAAFSIFGSFRTVPVIMKLMWEKGWFHVVCGDTKHEWLVKNPAGLWTILFILSKAPELIDTVFIVARKKKLIVLHVWHHISVLVFCFHSLATMCLNGLIYSSMNLTVHSLMYTFYMFTSMGYRPNKFAIYITLLQIVQMILGSACTYYVNYQMHILGTDQCNVDHTNAVAGLAMYASYLYLFCSFFYFTYLHKKPAKPKTT